MLAVLFTCEGHQDLKQLRSTVSRPALVTLEYLHAGLDTVDRKFVAKNTSMDTCL